MEPISPKDFGTLPGTEDWRVISDGANAYFRTGSMAAGARLVHAISELPDVDAHAPAVDVLRDGVTVRLVTYTDDYYGMTDRDLELARQISTAARALGFVAEPSKVQSFVVCVGALQREDVMPFWQAVLG
ncbi:MAG: 4a-hydroxytetrahydrobiopterin dehydratase [Chloroflexota bacterium]